MPSTFTLVVFLFVIVGVLAVVLFRRSLLAKALAIFLVTYPLGLWALITTFLLYQDGLAHIISRRNSDVVLLSSNPAYGKASILFHAALGIFLLGAGTYFGIRRFLEWRDAA